MKSKFVKIQQAAENTFHSTLQIQPIRIREYFPVENAVTIQIVNSTRELGGTTARARDSERKYPLGYRSDFAELVAPQPGDPGLLFATGRQGSAGFVLLTHSPGGDNSRSYVPVRGSWAI